MISFQKKIIVFWLSKAMFGIRDYKEIDAKSSHTMQQGANQSKTDLDIWCKICPKFFMSCPYDSRTQPWWKSCLLDGLVRTNRARPSQPNCQKGLEWLCWLVFCYYMGTNFFKKLEIILPYMSKSVFERCGRKATQEPPNRKLSERNFSQVLVAFSFFFA